MLKLSFTFISARMGTSDHGVSRPLKVPALLQIGRKT